MGTPKSPAPAKPPELPPPATPMTAQKVAAQAMTVGQSEVKGLLGRTTGRQSTRVTTPRVMAPGFLSPALVERRGLKTTLG